jgi:DNA polymerase-3 subunit epsilon
VWALARQAKADGVVTDLERSDLVSVCELLSVDASTLAQLLEPAAPVPLKGPGSEGSSSTALAGKTVCFTGELLGKVRGERVTRDVAEELARRAGLLVKNGVSKGLEILVVADPDTQSGKAKKARGYGTRIMAEAAFWAAIGAVVE